MTAPVTANMSLAEQPQVALFQAVSWDNLTASLNKKTPALKLAKLVQEQPFNKLLQFLMILKGSSHQGVCNALKIHLLDAKPELALQLHQNASDIIKGFTIFNTLMQANSGLQGFCHVCLTDHTMPKDVKSARPDVVRVFGAMFHQNAKQIIETGCKAASHKHVETLHENAFGEGAIKYVSDYLVENSTFRGAPFDIWLNIQVCENCLLDQPASLQPYKRPANPLTPINNAQIAKGPKAIHFKLDDVLTAFKNSSVCFLLQDAMVS
jgi:hypothetical protein